MNSKDLSISLQVDQTPLKVFKAINNVSDWWTTIEGSSQKLDDVFTVRFGEAYITQKVIEIDSYKKVLWQVTECSEKEWIGTKIHFEIMVVDNQTEIHFTHQGMVPELSAYSDSLKGWNKFIKEDLINLIHKITISMDEIVGLFKELANEELWFDIQDYLFASKVKSIDPENSPYFGYAEGKKKVRKKGEDSVAKIEEVHGMYTTDPVVGGDHFAVGRNMDMTVRGFGRIQINEIMLYRVKDGEIVLEQFFY